MRSRSPGARILVLRLSDEKDRKAQVDEVNDRVGQTLFAAVEEPGEIGALKGGNDRDIPDGP